MALGQVSARIEGDLYQGLVFWKEASQLLHKNNTIVARVCFELDSAAGVDDVVVYYHKKIQTGSGEADSDYYQVKYHVDQKGSYSSDSFIDPKAINSTKSILQKFYACFQKLKAEGKSFRLFFMSNWNWDSTDDLNGLFREDDGALPAIFFTDGPKSKLGKIRNKWQQHLNICDDDFSTFAKCLRIKTNYLMRGDFTRFVSQSLELAGLKPHDPSNKINPYDALYQKLLIEKNNDFTAEKLRQICENEGLFIKEAPAPPKRIGIRGFKRFAERMEDTTVQICCLLDLFEGRHLKPAKTWVDVKNKLIHFFEKEEIRMLVKEEDVFLDLDCHLTSALIAGYELDLKSGARVFPIQKGGANIFWKPDGEKDPSWGWNEQKINIDGIAGNDIAVLVSITRPVNDSALDYIKNHSDIGDVYSFESNSGQGHQALSNALHAKTLANDLVQRLRNIKGLNQNKVVHLFVSAPNSFVYFLGQNREGLGSIRMYEFDFSNEKDSGYTPSISLPN